MKIVYLVELLFQNQNMLDFKQYCCSPFFKVFILLLYLSTISSAFSQTDSLATKSYEELTKLYKANLGKEKETAKIYITKAHQVA